MEHNLDEIFEELKKLIPDNLPEETKNAVITAYRFMLAVN